LNVADDRYVSRVQGRREPNFAKASSGKLMTTTKDENDWGGELYRAKHILFPEKSRLGFLSPPCLLFFLEFVSPKNISQVYDCFFSSIHFTVELQLVEFVENFAEGRS
jgi:hypothetical protein